MTSKHPPEYQLRHLYASVFSIYLQIFIELLNFLMQVAKSDVKVKYIFNKREVLFYYWNLFLKQIYFVGISLGKFCFALKHKQSKPVLWSSCLKPLNVTLPCRWILKFFENVYFSLSFGLNKNRGHRLCKSVRGFLLNHQSYLYVLYNSMFH